MDARTEDIIRIASEELAKLFAPELHVEFEVEEIERSSTGNYYVTLGYWARDSKPLSKSLKLAVDAKNSPRTDHGSGEEDSPLDILMNPWRRKFKRVEVDPINQKAIAIRMYEPPLGVA